MVIRACSIVGILALGVPAFADPYTIETLRTPPEAPFEVSGLAFLPGDRLAISIRKGDVWILENPEAEPNAIAYTRFATALHEPLGLAWHKDSLFAIQRSELTRMLDADDDGTADVFRTVNNAWGLTGNYHEYAYGPVIDADDHFWIALNQTIGPAKGTAQWRGWGARISPDGQFEPIAPGMRSPCGLGMNRIGDVFFTDQQGNWVPAGTLHHLRKGVFYGHPKSLVDCEHPDAPLEHDGNVPAGKPYPVAVAEDPALVPPAVWFPYKKMGMSATDVLLDSTGGKFGPFAGQLFVGDFTMAQINRVFLEKVNGEYQGACFPFLDGFQCAVLRLAWSPSGTLFVGETNRGWNSVGSTPYGLERVRWNGEVPFTIKTIEAAPAGFRLTFTQPIADADADDFRITSYTYWYHANYGSEEIETRDHKVADVSIADDRRSLHLDIPDRRQGYVHEIHAESIQNESGAPLHPAVGYYTLNAIPHE